jgi:tetratricopeptide (TPR) repeat protein
MASAVLRGLVECGALVAEDGAWQIEAQALADVQSSRHAAALLTRRLGLLADESRRLLSVAAVVGKEFDLDLAADLAALPPHRAILLLEDARRRHLVWAEQHGGRWVFMHDKLREALLECLAPEERRLLHGRAAACIEKLDAERVFELAYHFDAADESSRALPYALRAATQARSQHSLAVAERQYRLAERGAAAAGPTVQREVAEGLGEVLVLQGRYDEAGRQFQAACALADTDLVRAQLESNLGELAFKRGDVRTASQALERGLALLGRWVPRTTASLVVGLFWEVIVQALHTRLPRWFLARRRWEGAEAERLSIQLYSRLAYAYWFCRGQLHCLWAHLREMNLAERYPPSPQLAQAYSEHAPVMTMLPAFRRGMRYVEKSLAIRQAQGDVWGQGQSLNFYGVVLYAASRYQDAIEKFRQAIRLLERTGDRWESNLAHWHIAFSLYRLGELPAAVAASRRTYQAGQEIGDAHAMAISLGSWAKASGGEVPEELVRAELRNVGEDAHTRAELMQAEAVRLLRIDQPAAAVRILEEAQRMIDKARMRQEYVAAVLPWLATALRRELEQQSPWDPRRRRARLRHAWATARRAIALSRRYRNNLPHALREGALVAAMAGRSGRARQLFQESLALAQAQGARAEHAQTLLAQGQVGLVLNWPGADQDVATAQQMMQALQAEAEKPKAEPAASFTLSLAERFDILLDAGRQIASALSAEAVFTAVRETALKLLRAEQCQILAVDTNVNPPALPPWKARPAAASVSPWPASA